MKLTKATIANYALPSGKAEALLFDDALPGFGLRVRAGGKRTWIAQYRIGQKQRRISLGTVERIDLDEARRRAKSALCKVHLGIDPQLEKHAAATQASVTFAATRGAYLEKAARHMAPRTYSETKRYLETHWRTLGELPLADLRRAHVAAGTAEIAKTNGPYSANRARASLSAFFSWCIGEGLIEQNPVIGTNKAIDEVSRDRVLPSEELRLIWQEAGAGDYGDIVRLLILTGQRREEVGGILWPEIDLGNANWKIGAERTKNGLMHDVPLSPAAIMILKARSRRDENRELVFGSRAGPFQGWSNAKAALDGRVLRRLQTEHGPSAQLKPWRLHDIRRTVATRLGDLGVLPHVIEAVLNHVSGHKASVAGIYNRAAYAPEKRAALERWASQISADIDG